MSNVFEFAAFACLAAFAFFIWPPAAFIPAALYFGLVSFTYESGKIRAFYRDVKAKYSRLRGKSEPS